uniref:Uncharacterized protein n=1 Tax=uncultured bacterium A1Q1_fos_15 TaxID=1256548 RepID=L7VY96_9BACT|nr:hypothetical protein [uncultured bacterium A1Q1_fos_15]
MGTSTAINSGRPPESSGPIWSPRPLTPSGKRLVRSWARQDKWLLAVAALAIVLPVTLQMAASVSQSISQDPRTWEKAMWGDAQVVAVLGGPAESETHRWIDAGTEWIAAVPEPMNRASFVGEANAAPDAQITSAIWHVAHIEVVDAKSASSIKEYGALMRGQNLFEPWAPSIHLTAGRLPTNESEAVQVRDPRLDATDLAVGTELRIRLETPPDSPNADAPDQTADVTVVGTILSPAYAASGITILQGGVTDFAPSTNLNTVGYAMWADSTDSVALNGAIAASVGTTFRDGDYYQLQIFRGRLDFGAGPLLGVACALVVLATITAFVVGRHRRDLVQLGLSGGGSSMVGRCINYLCAMVLVPSAIAGMGLGAAIGWHDVDNRLGSLIDRAALGSVWWSIAALIAIWGVMLGLLLAGAIAYNAAALVAQGNERTRPPRLTIRDVLRLAATLAAVPLTVTMLFLAISVIRIASDDSATESPRDLVVGIASFLGIGLGGVLLLLCLGGFGWLTWWASSGATELYRRRFKTGATVAALSGPSGISAAPLGLVMLITLASVVLPNVSLPAISSKLDRLVLDGSEIVTVYPRSFVGDEMTVPKIEGPFDTAWLDSATICASAPDSQSGAGADEAPGGSATGEVCLSAQLLALSSTALKRLPPSAQEQLAASGIGLWTATPVVGWSAALSTHYLNENGQQTTHPVEHLNATPVDPGGGSSAEIPPSSAPDTLLTAQLQDLSVLVSADQLDRFDLDSRRVATYSFAADGVSKETLERLVLQGSELNIDRNGDVQTIVASSPSRGVSTEYTAWATGVFTLVMCLLLGIRFASHAPQVRVLRRQGLGRAQLGRTLTVQTLLLAAFALAPPLTTLWLASTIWGIGSFRFRRHIIAVDWPPILMFAAGVTVISMLVSFAIGVLYRTKANGRADVPAASSNLNLQGVLT